MDLSRTGFVATILLALGCAPPDTQLRIPFQLNYTGAPMSCSTQTDDDTQLTDLRFFAAEITLLQPSALDIDGIQLLDFEDASANCVNGTPVTTREITVIAPEADYQGLAFTLGVPFADNHQDPLQATSPLDQPAMHWHWRSGYKFLRAGIQRKGTRWHIHLGSTGCRGPFDAVISCERPNRARIQLPDWRPGDTVVLALDRLLEDIDFDSEAGEHCQAEIDRPRCRTVMRNLGIDPDSGRSVGGQRVFHVQTN